MSNGDWRKQLIKQAQVCCNIEWGLSKWYDPEHLAVWLDAYEQDPVLQTVPLPKGVGFDHVRSILHDGLGTSISSLLGFQENRKIDSSRLTPVDLVEADCAGKAGVRLAKSVPQRWWILDRSRYFSGVDTDVTSRVFDQGSWDDEEQVIWGRNQHLGDGWYWQIIPVAEAEELSLMGPARIEVSLLGRVVRPVAVNEVRALDQRIQRIKKHISDNRGRFPKPTYNTTVDSEGTVYLTAFFNWSLRCPRFNPWTRREP